MANVLMQIHPDDAFGEQRIFFKKKFKLCRVIARGHSAKKLKKKIQTLPSASQRALGKEIFLKKIQTLPSASQRALGKEFF